MEAVDTSLGGQNFNLNRISDTYTYTAYKRIKDILRQLEQYKNYLITRTRFTHS